MLLKKNVKCFGARLKQLHFCRNTPFLTVLKDTVCFPSWVRCVQLLVTLLSGMPWCWRWDSSLAATLTKPTAL